MRVDLSSGARKRRELLERDAVVMPLGLTYALTIFVLCVLATVAVVTKGARLW